MPDQTYADFLGIDRRRLREASTPRAARYAKNLDVDLNGEYVTRSPLRRHQDLDARSVGLYSLGGTLRAVIPGGQGADLQSVGSVHVKYDHIGANTGQFTSRLVACVPSSNLIELVGGTWPAWAVGGTLTIDASGTPYTFTVISLSADLRIATVNGPWVAPAMRSYAFLLTAGPQSFGSITVAVENDSNDVTLTGAVWPADLRGTSIGFPDSQFSAAVSERISNTVIRMSAPWDGPSQSAIAFMISGVAGVYPTDTIKKLTGVESVGANAAFGIYPYLVLERWYDPADPSKGTYFEHHWITSDAIDGTTAPNTLVPLPFSPGASIVKASGKLWAPDDVNGVVRFSSTANGPRDWLTPQDAGYIPVLTHTSGDRRIRGLGMYDDKLAVIFADSVQLWATDEQPSNITLVRALNGPGTTAPDSVVNVLGDLFYFTSGGFRSLRTVVVTGQIREQDDIGGPVDQMTRPEDSSVSTALWSQSRGQYLCAFGNRVYAFRYAPEQKIKRWTTWELPVTVDYMTELNGVLFIRSGNALYSLDPAGTEAVEYELVLNDFVGPKPSVRKRIDFLAVSQRGTSQVSALLDATSEDVQFEGPTIIDTTINDDIVALGVLGRSIGLRFTGRAPWRLSAFTVSFTNYSR